MHKRQDTLLNFIILFRHIISYVPRRLPLSVETLTLGTIARNRKSSAAARSACERLSRLHLQCDIARDKMNPF